MISRSVEIAGGGTLVIPASLQRERGISDGDTVILDIADGALRIRSRGAALSNARRLFRRLVPEGVGLCTS